MGEKHTTRRLMSMHYSLSPLNAEASYKNIVHKRDLRQLRLKIPERTLFAFFALFGSWQNQAGRLGAACDLPRCFLCGWFLDHDQTFLIGLTSPSDNRFHPDGGSESRRLESSHSPRDSVADDWRLLATIRECTSVVR